MNLLQITSRMLQTASISQDQYDQRILARSIVNEIVEDFCLSSPELTFLTKTAQFASTTDRTTYALPKDFERIADGGCKYGDGELRFVYASDENRWADNTTWKICTINSRTSTPYYNTGTIFTKDGESIVDGSGTTWDSGIEDRFLVSARDGMAFRIEQFLTNTRLRLAQRYNGFSCRGRINTIADTPRLVYGAPFRTRFLDEMIGRYISIAGESANRQITHVDAISQILTVDQDLTVFNSDLVFSISDEYEIDPAGHYILECKNWTPEDDTTLFSIKYYSKPEAVYDWYREIDFPYPSVLVSGCIAEYLRATGRNVRSISGYDRQYRDRKAMALNNEDPLNNTGRTIPTGDIS